MNFKLGKLKVFSMLILGLLIGLLIGWQRMKLGWRFNLGSFVLFFVLSILIIYIIWSLFEKKKKKK
ncbi:MAG: hypothetical protein WC867_04630 [Candidatus Pacearchaeota archaeon]|jgi:high-affinity Fe2+/Pb2+ permease